MKKRIIFVMESLRIGGAEKSLVTILSLLDKDKYDIDLYLFRPSGEFLAQVPKEVKILLPQSEDKIKKDFKTDWIRYFLRGKFKRSFYSLKWLVNCCYSKYIKHEEEYLGWNIDTHLYSDIPGEYDVAIGFLEKKTTYFVVDHVKAKKKMAFMHTDYDAIPHDKELDNIYYNQLDYLAVVSEHTKETMLKHFPSMNNKVKIIKNMVSPEIIYKMADTEKCEIENGKSDLKIATVGRLTLQKKIDGAVEILRILRNQGIDAEWFVVGEGEERKKLEEQIKKYELEDKFHLVGAKANPYPYMKNCDIYVQPSRWEGYGITVAEAKVLCKPIVTSDIPEFREQLTDGVTGIIRKETEEMAKAIIEIYQSEKLREMLIDNLTNCVADFEELKKLEKLF